MKTEDLTGGQLDYWVARANGWTFGPPHKKHGWDVWRDSSGEIVGTIPAHAFNPSADWSDGGPIIERERGAFITYFEWPGVPNGREVAAKMGLATARYAADGLTHLVAAMRAYVGSKFGGEVPDDEHRAAAHETATQADSIAPTTTKG